MTQSATICVQIVQNTITEPTTEEELEAVYDKMMTPVPVKGLDPKTPRQVIACPQSIDGTGTCTQVYSVHTCIYIYIYVPYIRMLTHIRMCP